MEIQSDKEIHKTPLFKQLLKIASDIILSRFKLLKLAGQAAYKLFHPDTGESVQTEIKHKLQLFLRMIKSIAKQEYKKFPKQSLIKIVAGVLYFVLVLDILPDFIPFIGFLDDVFIISWVYESVKTDLEEFEEWEGTFAVEYED
jgi:uncharacterized membrane protein YkvA (DUF1232 family)